MGSKNGEKDRSFGQTTPLGIPKKSPRDLSDDLGQTTPLGPARSRQRPEASPDTGPGSPAPARPEKAELPPTVMASRTGTGVRGGLHGHTFLAGDVLSGRYEVIRFIAKGGMGEVYEARDLELKEVMALKTIRPDIAGEGEVLQRFKREIQLARRVSHPNVCRIFDLFHHEIPGDPPVRVAFLTMELLRGVNLSDRLIDVEGPMEPAEAFPIVRQIAGALDAAHDLGIVHRDLKAGNVMLVPAPSGKGERVVVTDFGLAKGGGSSMAATLTMQGAAMGTPAYMAPEQLEGGSITTAVDIYAFGVLIYEMVTGSWPFIGDTALSTAIKRLKEPPPSPRVLVPDLDERWEQGILRCLEREPENRFRSASDLVEFLSATGEPLPVAAAPSRKAWVLGAGLAAIALVAGTLLLPRFLPKSEKVEPVASEPMAAAATSAPVQPSIPIRPAFAVLGLKNTAGRGDVEWLSTALAEMLASELSAGGQLRRISSADVARSRIELDLPDTPSLGSDSLRRMREVLGMDIVVAGSFLVEEKDGTEQLRIDVNLQDAESGETLISIPETGDANALSELVSRIGEGLRQALELEELSQAEADEIRAALPASGDAARLYAEGLDRLLEFDALAAKDKLLQAAAVDPTSARIHAALASTWAALGHDAEARLAAEKAVQLSEGLSRESQKKVEALYSEMSHQWPRAVEIYSSLREFYPDDLEYGLALVRAQVAAGQAMEADVTLTSLRSLPSGLGDDPRISLAEAEVAEALSEYPRQRQAAARAVELGARRGAQLLVARARLAEAPALIRLGSIADARMAASEAREAFDAAGDRIGMAEAVNEIAKTHYYEGDLEAAETLWQEYLDLSLAAGHKSGESRALNNLALIQQARGETETALALNTRSLRLRRQIGDRSGEAMALNNIAVLVKDQGDFAEAESMYRESLAIRREIGDESGVATSLNNIASLIAEQGRLEEAWEMLEEALEIKRRIGEKTGVAMALNNLGNVAHRRGDLRGAAESLGESLAIKREIGEKSGVARTTGNLGTVTLEMGDPRGAEKLYEESKRLSEELGDEAGVAAAEFGLAEVHALRGYIDDARGGHSKALAIRTRSGDVAGAAQSRWALAILALSEGRPEESEKGALQVLENLDGHDPAQELQALSVLGRAQYAQGRTKDCLETLARAEMIPRTPATLAARLDLELVAARIEAEGADGYESAVARVEVALRQAEEGALVGKVMEARLVRARLETDGGDAAIAQTLFERLADDAQEAGFASISRAASEASGGSGRPRRPGRSD